MGSRRVGSRKRFIAEFLAATAIHTLFVAWYFRAPLLSGHVDSIDAPATPTAENLERLGEMAYELAPALAVQAREIKEGTFPGWTPYSQGGTPLIGKMQNGVFAPYHLPLYVLPRDWMPWVFTGVTVLKSYLAFAFTYLYARCLGLSLLGGLFASTTYLPMIHGNLFAWFGTGIYLPLLLLLLECHFWNFRRVFRFSWPWAVAFLFYAGHFEGAFRVGLVCGTYFLLHLRRAEETPERKRKRLGEIAALTLLGLGLASLQILPAVEYVNVSFTNVWHSLEEFAWQYNTISKRLSWADAPLLLAGLAAAGAFLFLLRGCLAAPEPWRPANLLRTLAAALVLAVSIASLANLGLDDSFIPLAFSRDYAAPSSWLIGFFLLVFSLWRWSLPGPYGLRILGWILIGGILVSLKTPPISNLLLCLPLIKHFHNTVYRWEFHLALSVLCGAALDRCRLPTPWPERVRTTLKASALLLLFGLGAAASRPLTKAVARLFPTGVPFNRPGEPASAGGFMGPERRTLLGRSLQVTGWVPCLPPVTSLNFGSAVNSRKLAGISGSRARLSGERLYFEAGILLPEAKESENFEIVVQARREDGTEQILHGPVVHAIRSGPRPGLPRGVLAASLALPALFLLGPWAVTATELAVMVLSVLPLGSEPIAAEQIPYRLPGISRILEDRELFRISSLRYDFFKADYPSLYGLADLRTGGDNLDVLSMIHFLSLSRSFLGDPQTPEAFEKGLRLWGLANVRYLVDRPGLPSPHPALTLHYQGPDLTIFGNAHARPRSAFFERYAHIPLDSRADWKSRDRWIKPVLELIRGKDFDWDKTLLLHDAPAGARGMDGPPPGQGESPGEVKVTEYLPDRVSLAVQTQRPGLVFLADNFFPGWKALVNGEPAKILRSWITFRAVEVPAGRSSVLFLYRPWWLLPAIALCAAIAAGWLVLYRRCLLGGNPAPATPRPEPDTPDSLEAGQRETCALLAEILLVALTGSVILFWTAWGAFIHGA